MTCSQDIAIVGMAGLYPKAKDIHAFWHNILNQVDCIEDAPDKWVGPYLEELRDDRPFGLNRLYTRKVGLLGDLSQFDPLEFGIPPFHVEGDPGHFLALRMARDAIRHAGYEDRPFDRERTGIVLGRGAIPNRAEVTGMHYGVFSDQAVALIHQLFPHLDDETIEEVRQELLASLPQVSPDMCPGLVSNVAAGRIANRLDLMGPNYLIDAACSSTLIAVDLAIKELSAGRCDMMLAGGVQGSMPPVVYQLFCQLRALSKESIRPFDQRASGTVLSEGVGFLVLKRLTDAERDHDCIYAVIKGIGLSSDGKAKGLLTPRLEGEVLALRRAYEQTGIDPASVELIEAHGTGIPLGDRTEIQALTEIFGQRQAKLPHCALGSVKSMIGHCIPASGSASLIKTALALHYKTLPPTLCDQVNPDLSIENTPFYINNVARPWIHGEHSPRRAGVSAFGFGGINAHLILEEYRGESNSHRTFSVPSDSSPRHNTVVLPCHGKQAVWPNWQTELVLFVAPDRQQLCTQVQTAYEFITTYPETALADLAYTLSSIEGHCRLAVVASSTADLAERLKVFLEKVNSEQPLSRLGKHRLFYGEDETLPGEVAFLFSSEGAQYASMLADLCLYFPKVRAWFDFLDETFDRVVPPSRLIFPPPTGLTQEERAWTADQLYAGDVATEAVFCASMALHELLRDLQIPCQVMLGHSAGEHVAGRASGMAPFESREQFMEQLRHLNDIYRDLEAGGTIPRGVLMSVGALAPEVLSELMQQDAVYLVSDNCPNQVILFVESTASQAVANTIQEAGGLCVPLPFDRAYHTPLFKDGAQSLVEHYAVIQPGDTGSMRLYSCSTTEPYPEDHDAACQIAANQWVLPVRFRETIEKLYQEGVRTFIEVGPSGNLIGFVDDILRGKDYLALPTNLQRRRGLEQIQLLLAQFLVRGGTANLSALYRQRLVQTINFNQRPEDKEPQKSSVTVLNHDIPKISLNPEFIAKIRSKLFPYPSNQPLTSFSPSASHPPTTSGQPDPGVPHPSSGQTGTSASTSPATQPRRNGNTPPMTDSAQLGQAQTTGSSLMEEHFALMQEFLSSQARVAGAIFSSQPHQNPPGGDNSDDMD
jgi:acyl transferase domain-containing protein